MRKKFTIQWLFRMLQAFSIIMICNLGFINVTNAQSSAVIYVKKGSAVPGNGASWATAYPDLQSALNKAASTSGGDEIWLSAGEYKPTPTTDRTVSFVLPAGTSLYGGFKGTESNRTNRDWKKNRTVLSGDIGMFLDDRDNSYHVLLINGGEGTILIDGLIIKGGNANGSSGNQYLNSGGGMVILSTSGSSAPVIQNCLFIENKASGSGGAASIISDVSNVGAKFSNCEFDGNAAQQGGAVASYKVSGTNTPEITSCTFSTNTANQSGGAIANIGSDAIITGCKFSMNQALNSGGAIYNSGGTPQIKNNIMWKNFKGAYSSTLTFDQIINDQSNAVIQSNVIQGGFGTTTDQNTDADPKFVREPSFIGKYPRTSIIPVAWTDPKYENIMPIAGSLMPARWAYYAYVDHEYNKLYMPGQNIQVIDFNNLTNNMPTGIVYSDAVFGKIQRLENSIYQNTIYIATGQTGIFAIDRQTGTRSIINPLIGEPVSTFTCKVLDILVDKTTGLLYASIIQFTEGKLYGVLELNLKNNSKRWINTTSTPVSLPSHDYKSDNDYWSGHKFYLDEQTNTMYYSMGYGVWWWNRSTNQTGVFDMAGGIPLAQGNPGLPSNLVTHMFIDQTENKFYFATHQGLFVWNRNDNTSKVYNTSNSVMIDNLINHLDKNEEQHLMLISCENGGLFTLNTKTGEQKLMTKDAGNEVYPQLVDDYVSCSYFDKTDKKLYVSTWNPNGGVWIKDYNNLVPDYGDLNSKTTICQQATLDFQFEAQSKTIAFTPILHNINEGCSISYTWSFGDGVTSQEASPKHSYSPGNYLAKLTLSYSCTGCPTSQLSSEHQISIQNDPCGITYCAPNGEVGIGTTKVPAGYRLAVSGKSMMEGANLLLQSAWPDYVFDKEYEILPLLDLKRFIESNKHLPNIPSAATVEKEGIDIGEMSTLLMQKTEELTLYFIMLDEQLKKLELKNSKTGSK